MVLSTPKPLLLLSLIFAGATRVSASSALPPIEVMPPPASSIPGSPEVQASLQTSSFSTYPGYAGNLAVSGSVQVGQEGTDTQVLFFDLEGADPQCNSTADIEGVANACGIHVHAGLSCEDAGGHYWDDASVAEDPWKPVRYTTADGTGAASGQNVRVVTGRSLADVEGRTMVIHDITGARIACAVLQGSEVHGTPLLVKSFSKYPGYTGSLSTAGSVTIEQVGTGTEASQVLSFSITGADPTCGTANTTGVSNACGIHVHAGSDCTDATTIGGHFYDSATLAADPWKPIMYSASSGNAAGVTVRVVTGVPALQVLGRTVVVHDATGARIACGQIVKKAANEQTSGNAGEQIPLEASSFSTYPGYAGNLAVSGSVQVGQEGTDTQVLFFDLEGADPQCNSTADIEGVANACGIHVHAGLSCEDAGGHYWDDASVAEDPWKPVRYTTADGTGAASGQNVRVVTGRSLSDVEGRTMVIHDITGARIACALLQGSEVHGTPLLVKSFSKYPGYTGSLSTAGSVTIEQVGTGTEASQVLSFSITGADPTCGTADANSTRRLRGASSGAVPNACGIHVHEGSDCSDAATIGGHYYDLATNASDPWKPIMYNAPSGSIEGVTVRVVTGVTALQVLGRTLVVHDSTGARVACGQITKKANPEVQRPLEASSLLTYPGYAGNLAVSGCVQVGQEGTDTQVLFFDLEGADPQCNSTADIEGVANACGIHVHAGLSCEDAGGHYWDEASVAEDPWKPVRYTTADGTGATSGQNVRVVTGRSLADVEGRTMVIHDITGARIACALLPGARTTGAALRVDSFEKYPGYIGDLAVAGSMSVKQIGMGVEASQVLSFSFTGADPTCGTANTTGVSNACGIHVHEGSDCSDAATIGGHFYDSANYTLDPWKPIMYSAPNGAAAGVTVRVQTGVTNAEVVGRTMVVHDATGARIACGQIVNRHHHAPSQPPRKAVEGPTQAPISIPSGATLKALSSFLAWALLLVQML